MSKEKEVVIISDSDSDADFFTMKVRRPIRPKPTTSKPQSSLPPPSKTINLPSDSEDSENEKKKRRPKKKAAPVLPEWTRNPRGEVGQERQRSAKRGSTEDMSAGSEVRDGTGADKVARRKLSLTPPPQLSKAAQERILRLLDDHFQESLPPPKDTEFLLSSSPTSGDSSTGSVQIYVKMIADSSKKVPGSENAIKHYEKTRVFQLALCQPLTVMINALSSQIHKQAENLVFTYNGQRIYATSSPISKLGITTFSELIGYEKPLYEKLEKEKRYARALEIAELAGEAPPTPPSLSSEPNSQSNSKPKSPNPQPQMPISIPVAPPTKPKIKLKLRAHTDSKEYKVNVELSNTVEALIGWYCGKSGRVEEQGTVQLEYDGEVLERDTLIGDVGFEDNDLVDVV